MPLRAMSRVVLSSRGEADLDNIWLFIAQHSPADADRFIDAILATCQTLAGSPMMGRARPELGRNLRGFPHRRYLIVYRPIRGGIEVTRIVHGSRRLSSLF